MAEDTMQTATLEDLKEAIRGKGILLKRQQRLKPIEGMKVFPASYAGDKYAHEKRYEDTGKPGEQVATTTVPTVILNSVQAQANLFEASLKAAREAEKITMPMLAVDLTEIGLPALTLLDLPHRAADVYIQESYLGGQLFPKSADGQAYEQATPRNATGLLEICPTGLLFGIWNSRSKMRTTFARVLRSEIVGWHADQNTVHPISRIDPLPIASEVEIYKAKQPDDTWTPFKDDAETDGKGKPVLLPSKNPSKKQPGRPSLVGFGNVTPNAKSELGGVEIRYATESTTLSLSGVRRLRFPVAGGKDSADRNAAAWTLIVAMGLVATTYDRDSLYFLRSGCELQPDGAEAGFEIVYGDGTVKALKFTRQDALDFYRDAVQALTDAGFTWRTETVMLNPGAKTLEVIRQSLEKGAEDEDGE